MNKNRNPDEHEERVSLIGLCISGDFFSYVAGILCFLYLSLSAIGILFAPLLLSACIFEFNAHRSFRFIAEWWGG